MLLCSLDTAIKMPTTSAADTSSCSDVSDVSDDSSTPGKQKADDICRDFLRNVCKRGQRCKYRHPTGTETRVLGQLHEYTFCHDFQNSGCRRPNCKFIHCTREEEDYYKQTGQLPVRLQQAAALGIGVLPKSLPVLRGEVPICKDYLKGECKRAGRCKFRHLTLGQYDLEVKRSEQPLIANTAPPVNAPAAIQPAAAVVVDNGFTMDASGAYEMAIKRRRVEIIPACSFPAAAGGFAAATAFHATPMPTVAVTADYLGQHLDVEENHLLKRKVDELKKQITTLIATNDVLLEQNARFRQDPTKLCNVTITNAPPIVTVSQVVTPTITPAPAVARQQHPAPIVTPIATAQQMAHVASAQQISNCVSMLYEQKTAEIVALNARAPPQLTAQQLAAQPLAPPPTSMPQPPPPATMTPQATSVMVPVSMIDTSLAPPGALTGAQVSMAHELHHQRQAAAAVAHNTMTVNALAQTNMTLTAPPMGSVHNNTAAALVSYPLISHAANHNTRTIAHLPNSSLAVGCLQQTG